MSTPHQSHAAMLQLIAEGMRAPMGGGLSASQRDRIAGLLDRIAVELLLPTDAGDDVFAEPFAQELERRSMLHN